MAGISASVLNNMLVMQNLQGEHGTKRVPNSAVKPAAIAQDSWI